MKTKDKNHFNSLKQNLGFQDQMRNALTYDRSGLENSTAKNKIFLNLKIESQK